MFGDPGYFGGATMLYRYPGTNQLRRLQESADDENYNYWSFEIEKQNNPNNYKYDSIGNLISDVYEDITNIRWNVYGKIREISHWAYDVVPASKIRYIYDAQGNRIGEVTEQYNGPATNYTWYVRDPQGNIIAVYKASGDTSLTSLNPNVNSYLVYGSSRLGTQYTNIGVNGGPGLRNLLDSITFTRGYRIYELTNHLGNVVTTITDRKWGTPVGASGSAISYYNADVNTATDYFPFGMPMVGRVHISYGQFYRFGFNGKMNDDDVKGYFKQQDYGMRIYDPRVGRFLSVDPLSSQYPWYTPYQFAGNSPIANIDLDGLEEKLAIYAYSKDDAEIEHISYQEIELQAHQQRPEFGNKGTLTKYYIQNPITGKTDTYEVYATKVEVKKEGFWNKLFGKSEWLPQIQIFGSGSESFGKNADPSKPIVSVNISNNELFDILLLGIEGPEKYGPLSEVDKYEEAVKLIDKIKNEATSNNTSNQKKQDPIIIRETKKGQWNYYRSYKNGSVGEYNSEKPDQLLLGKDGAPDTIKKVSYTAPIVPKKDIPRKN